MKTILFRLLKNYILAFILLYTINTLLINVNIFIPINFFTIIVSTLLGFTGTLSLVFIVYMIL